MIAARIHGLRATGLFTLVAVLLGVTLHADEPAMTKPQWQRYLPDEQEKKAADLKKQWADLTDTEHLEDALKVAEALAELRCKAQGMDHWQAVSARWDAEGIRRILKLKGAAREDYAGMVPLLKTEALLRKRGRFDQAQPLLEKALDIYRKALGEDHPLTAIAYNNVGMNLNLQGKRAEADKSLSKALDIYRKTVGEDHPDTANCFVSVAMNLAEQRKYVEAAEGFRMALVIRRKVLGEDHAATASAYNHVASNLNSQRKYAEAEGACRKALAVCLKSQGEGDRTTANSLVNLAENLNAQGKHSEAEEVCRKAVDVCRKVLGENHRMTARMYNYLASSLHVQGWYSEAEENGRKALAINRRAQGEDDLDTAASYGLVALILKAQGKYAEAAVGFSTTLAINRKVLGENHPTTATTYFNEAANLSAQGKYAQAEIGFRKSLVIKLNTLGENHTSTANSYSGLSHTLNAQGKYMEAAEGFRKALAISREAYGEYHPFTAICYNNAAFNLSAQNKFTDADDGFRMALAINRKVLGEDHPRTAVFYNTMAGNLSAQGKYAEAETGFRKALGIRRQMLGENHPDTVSSFNNVAFNLSDQGKYTEAEDYFQRGADGYAKTRLQVAATGLDRASTTSRHSHLDTLAALLARNGKPDLAWQRLGESLGRGTWDDLSARLRRPEEERVKQDQLAARLQRLDQLFERTLTPGEPTPEQKRRRDDLFAQRLKAQEELIAFTQDLEVKYGPIAGQVFDRAAIQASLPADTALIAWVDWPGKPKAHDPSGERWAVLMRSTGVPVWERMRGTGPKGEWTDDDSRLVGQFRTALQTPRGDWKGLAKRLGEQRLAPLARHLGGIRRLIVLPSTAMAGVPVEVIAEGVTVSYHHSGTMYAHFKNQPRPTTAGLFALGDPVFELPDRKPTTASRGGPWPPLPGTRVEIETLRRLFDAPMVLTDSDASEQRLYALAQSLELGKYRYLHLATHGEVNDQFPLRSAVILSRDNLPDSDKQFNAGLPIYNGELTAEKVLRHWHLNADLVTLSACQTALGKHERGEGFVGFAQALMLAGTRSVCLSLWEVNDAATALLMERFYQNLLGKRAGLTKPMPKVLALEEAKSWLRTLPREEALQRAAVLTKGVARGKGRPVQELLPPIPEAAKSAPPYAHPFYWAAFVLIGDPE
jgi:CHAT domain-containing protein